MNDIYFQIKFKKNGKLFVQTKTFKMGLIHATLKHNLTKKKKKKRDEKILKRKKVQRKTGKCYRKIAYLQTFISIPKKLVFLLRGK